MCFNILLHVGLAVHGPITHNAFLHKMGIRERIEVRFVFSIVWLITDVSHSPC